MDTTTPAAHQPYVPTPLPEGMHRVKLTVQYQGTAYHGWQAQVAERGPTIEGLLRHAWGTLTDGMEPDLTFHVAGRTDAGVHSWGNVAHIDTVWAHGGDSIKVMGGLNRFLPPDIRVVRAAQVGPDFHARFTAHDRAYGYLLYNRPQLRPDLLGRTGFVRLGQPSITCGTLNMMAMWQALQALPLGAHDFSAFRDADCTSKRPVCLLHWREILDLGEGLYRVNLRADHFLHHMVRNLMGTLVEIGLGQRPVTGLADVLAARDRTLAGPTFSPDGLYLTRIGYPAHAETDVVGM